jgi:regulation of enolase protein 1 (concanavalin A-like superfamily)
MSTASPVASFSLNGGASEFLQVGADDRRLVGTGDFNVEIAATRLLRGLNTLTITFVDLYGATTTQSVEILAEQGRQWPLPYSIDWDQVTDLTDVAQVVDGHWRVENGQLRTVDIGYDRLVAVGDLDWTDYELTVPITPHSKDDSGYEFPSSGPAIGLLLRWPGHYQVDDRQPRWGYAPLGALGWYRFQTNGTNKLVLSDGDGLNDVSGPNTFQLQFGTTYVFKMRVQTITTGANPGHQYTLSVWQQGQPEQSGVTISSLQPLTGVQSGSALLVAHHIDASFGDISVTRINSAIKPTISPAGGIYTAGQTISITSPDPTATIYYTVDGSEPTTSSKQYTGPFVLNVDATIKAMTVRPGVDVSSVTTESYFIRKSTPIRSDAFSSGVVDTSVWTLLDPQDDALSFFSRTTTDARLNLFVPAGRSHDLFDTRLLAPRLLQAAPNSDFEIEAKFQGTYSGTFTMQGLIAQQTFKDFVRVDVYRTGSQRRLYAATFVNGVATTRLDVAVPIGTTSFPDVHLRLRRQGSTFTVLWSADGQTWTSAGSFSHPMVVSAVGPWVGSHSGNGSTSQGMTAIIDHFTKRGGADRRRGREPPGQPGARRERRSGSVDRRRCVAVAADRRQRERRPARHECTDLHLVEAGGSWQRDLRVHRLPGFHRCARRRGLRLPRHVRAAALRVGRHAPDVRSVPRDRRTEPDGADRRRRPWEPHHGRTVGAPRG